MLYKKIITLLSVSLVFNPVFAGHSSLTINNQTPSQFSLAINQTCAKKLGVLSPNTQANIPLTLINSYCGSSCLIKLYNQPNCEGEHFATLVLNAEKGIVDYFNLSRYSLKVEAFKVSVGIIR